MTINNRRLREVRKEKAKYSKLLEEADSISSCLIYQGKLDILEKEENEILKRYDVIT